MRLMQALTLSRMGERTKIRPHIARNHIHVCVTVLLAVFGHKGPSSGSESVL